MMNFIRRLFYKLYHIFDDIGTWFLLHAVDKSKERTFITDGFGNYWDKYCPDCGAEMMVMRPGEARCSEECDLDRENQE